jgi:hypothetical protein
VAVKGPKISDRAMLRAMAMLPAYCSMRLDYLVWVFRIVPPKVLIRKAEALDRKGLLDIVNSAPYVSRLNERGLLIAELEWQVERVHYDAPPPPVLGPSEIETIRRLAMTIEEYRVFGAIDA